jgi:hypothetical protein
MVQVDVREVGGSRPTIDNMVSVFQTANGKGFSA